MVSLNEPQMSRHTGADVGAIDIYAQILDVLFDIYGEEERIYDVVFRKHGFLASLQAVLPTFRRLVSDLVSARILSDGEGRVVRLLTCDEP